MTGQTKHTPGPWKAYGTEVYADEDCEYHPIAVTSCNETCRSIEEQEANARAISATPDLLAALIHLEHNARKSGAEMGLALVVAREAIAKATGSTA